MKGFIKHDGFCGEITGMNPKANFENILQQAMRYHPLRFAGLFNLQASVHYVSEGGSYYKSPT